MACSKGCGGGSASVGMSQNLSAPQNGDMVLIQYSGLQSQKQRLKSRTGTGDSYIFSGNRRKFFVHKADVAWLTAMQGFQLVAEQPKAVAALEKEESTVLKSEMPNYNPQSDFPLDVLKVDPKELGFFKKAGYISVNMIRRASDAELLTNEGIGPSRVRKVREAIERL